MRYGGSLESDNRNAVELVPWSRAFSAPCPLRKASPAPCLGSAAKNLRLVVWPTRRRFFAALPRQVLRCGGARKSTCRGSRLGSCGVGRRSARAVDEDVQGPQVVLGIGLVGHRDNFDR